MNIRLKTLSTLLLLAAAPFSFVASAAEFTVNGLFDDNQAHDTSPGDGLCTDDFGDCQLRTAIEETNALPGRDDIFFDVAGTITINAVTGALPQITSQLAIDGRDAPGYAGVSVNLEDAPPVVYIDGTELGGSTGGTSVRGLRFGSGSGGSGVFAIGITNFRTGIDIASSSASNDVESCYIGVLADGSAAGNATGIFLGSGSNFIGGLSGYGNVISANTSSGVGIGITPAAEANSVVSNRIGTTPNGVSARGNGVGINGFGSDGTRVGTFNDTLDYGNLISGNVGAGILMLGSDTVIAANTIGINKNGAPLPNGGIGIDLRGDNNVVGSTDTNGENDIANNTDGIVIDGDGNTITGNTLGSITLAQGNSGDGIRIEDGSGNNILANTVFNSGGDGIDLVGDSTMVEDNIVGFADFAAGGIQDFGNDGEGIHVRSSNNEINGNSIGFSGDDGIDIEGFDNYVHNNFIGSTSDGRSIANTGDGVGLDSAAGPITGNDVDYNTIAFNGESGVDLGVGVGNDNLIYGNSIYSNASIGIDLDADGITPNDPGDGDSGPNKLQNFPTILSATVDTSGTPAQLTVQWRIDSATSNSTYDILGDFYLADSAGSRQGHVYLGTDGFATAPNVTVTSTLALPAGFSGGFLLATATDGNGLGSTSEFSSAIEFGDSDIIFADGFDP